MRLRTEGLSHGLQNSPPDCFAPCFAQSALWYSLIFFHKEINFESQDDETAMLCISTSWRVNEPNREGFKLKLRGDKAAIDA